MPNQPGRCLDRQEGQGDDCRQRDASRSGSARDPVEAPDGSIWWVGQWADILGRLDAVTGDMQEFALPAGAAPHSVTIGPDGSPWYTGNGNGTLGRLDPETGEVEVFPMPDPAATDPHTAE